MIPTMDGMTPGAAPEPTEPGAPAATAAEPPRRARDPFRSLNALMRREGDVARYRTGTEQAYMVNHPDYIRHVLVDNFANYSKDTFVNANFKESLAEGILVSEGEAWRTRRRLISPAFHRQRLVGFADAMVADAVRTADRLERFAGTDEPVDLAVEMGTLTMIITARVLFGVDLTDRADSAGKTIAEGVRGIVAPQNEGFRAGVEEIMDLVATIVDERAAEPGQGSDVISMLLESRDDEGNALSREQIHDEVITLLLAGHETTANGLAWTWVLLMANPWAMDLLQAETRDVLDGGRRLPEARDLAALRYTRMVFEESLRMYPPAWILGRRALADDVIGGQAIPAGTVVAISPYLLHRHPAFWVDPERFDPERFSPDRSASRKPFSYLPFGGGPRLCIGHTMAMVEAQLAIATIASRYRFEAAPGHVVEPERLFVLRPRGGVPALVRRA
jgi:cytochrome P450